ncbi:MAG: hypothetical protein JW904_09455 [Spirochaetales bacterium]|nr:hypothetical protein [Spirochaetales bacterium]
MVIKTHLRNLAGKALCESMTVKLMVQLIQEMLPGYDLHKQFGSRESISIPSANAAKQIIEDICNAQLFPDFVQLLICAQNRGFRGRKYPIAYLSRIIQGLQIHGYIFDSENSMFVEDSRIHKSVNWGVLREGIEYEMTFLRFDICGNSKLVRNNSRKKIEKTYHDLFSMVNTALERRNGRLWTTQGDGGLAAFCFSRKDLQATMCAVEILHDLFFYNRIAREISTPLEVRFAIHSGRHVFSLNTESLKKNDTIKEISDIESKFTQPNSVTVSNKVFVCLDRRIADLFSLCKERHIYALYNYKVNLE